LKNGRFTLEVAIPDAARAELHQDEHLLAVSKPPGDGIPNVIWVALPVLERNVLTWREGTGGIYASRTLLEPGDPLRATDRVVPALEAVYRFDGTQLARDHRTPIPHGRHAVRNNTSSAIVAGCFQPARLNGRTIASFLNASVVIPGRAAEFSPPSRLYLWREPSCHAGAIVAAIPPDAISLPLDEKLPLMVVRYSGDGRFESRRFVTSRVTDR
jgi:hypothetical protein